VTIIRIGRKGSNDYMEFAFESEFEAYTFYSTAINHYREDDFFISMAEENNDEDLHIRTDEGANEESLFSKLLERGILIKLDGTSAGEPMPY